MFRKLLVANRGEIAIRIIRTCRRLGVRTVAVYSDPDKDSLHVTEADEAYRLEGFRSRNTYLDSEKILAIARETGAEAIHPGYGFLSERASFARACEQAGIIFIGPKPEVIEMMGDKMAARRAAVAAGVPVVPGSLEPLRSMAELKQLLVDIGAPILLKAASGGGGKGIRAVWHADGDDFTLASNEAREAFGDERLYAEKYLTSVRHVEVQLLGDGNGKIWILGDRDCSAQRRHQKLVEEGPALLPPGVRLKMWDYARRIGKHCNYENAGTVEFILDGETPYFIEVNTRLQVEHPVTEAVTSLDIVALMLQVAAGDAVNLPDGDPSCQGHAIEVRLYAEDPAQDFRPSPGRITAMQFPDDIRIDVGFEPGKTIPPFYDAMIGKLIVHGKDRAEAVEKMRTALAQSRLEGVATNIPMLRSLLSSMEFDRGAFDTKVLERLLTSNGCA